MFVYLNGRFVPADQAVVPIDDPGFAFGEGVYETVLIRKTRPLFWEEHWTRLCASADALDIEVPMPFAQAGKVLGELVLRNHLPDAVGRLHLTGHGPPPAPSAGGDGRRLRRSGPPSTLLIRVVPARAYSADEVLHGWKVVLSQVPYAPFLPHVKHTSRLAAVLARREAAHAGAQEAILLDPRGVLLEGTRSNLFFFGDGVLHTPALESGILSGVTREKVLLLARREGLVVNEGLHLPAELAAAQEVFLSFTSAGVMPVSDVDGRPVGSGRIGPATQRLRLAYERLLGNALARTPALV